MLHPDTELRYIGEDIGVGVFATRLIPKGTVIWVQDDLDMVFEPAEVERLDDTRREYVTKYAFVDQFGRSILCWDHARFFNHSFTPSCVGTAYELELASRDIRPGDELTDDYGSLNLAEPFDCRPEPGCERDRPMPDDVLRYGDEWDRLALEAFTSYDQVAQPLAPLIRPEFRAAIREAVEHGVLRDSIKSTWFAGAEQRVDHPS
jgi:hypothetical protein